MTWTIRDQEYRKARPAAVNGTIPKVHVEVLTPTGWRMFCRPSYFPDGRTAIPDDAPVTCKQCAHQMAWRVGDEDLSLSR